MASYEIKIGEASYTVRMPKRGEKSEYLKEFEKFQDKIRKISDKEDQNSFSIINEWDDYRYSFLEKLCPQLKDKTNEIDIDDLEKLLHPAEDKMLTVMGKSFLSSASQSQQNTPKTSSSGQSKKA